MNPLEAMMWRAEADPRMRSTTAAIELLDVVPDWERLRHAHEWGSRMVRRLRQRVAEPPLGIGMPAWELDPTFELGRHLQRVVLNPPAGMRELLDFAAEFVSAPFDRGKPLWEARLVEGLEAGRAAYVLKLHHSLADGIGNVQLLEMLHSDQRAPMLEKPWRNLPAVGGHGASERLIEQLSRTAQRIPVLAVRAARGGIPAAAQGAVHPRRAAVDVLRFVASLERLAAAPPAPPSPLLAPRSLRWRFETLELPLAALRAAGKAAGGSLNDAFLAGVLGALRRYHEEFGVAIVKLPMAIPVSIRREQDTFGGNRFAGLRLAAPMAERDVRRRIERIRELVAGGRDEPAFAAVAELAPLLGLLPAPLVARIGARVTQLSDVQASNVPGLRRDAYIAGAKVTRVYPFGPLSGCAAMIALVSHQRTCCIGANLDAAAFTEPDLFASCLAEGFAEVLDVHGTPRSGFPPRRT